MLLLLEVGLGQGHQLLCTGGVESHSVVEIILGGAHLESNSEALQHLITALADNVDANNLLLGASADELEGRGGLMALHGIVQARELGNIDRQVIGTILLLGLLFRQTDSSSSRVRKDDRGDVSVVELGVLELLTSEQAVRKTTTGSNGDYERL